MKPDYYPNGWLRKLDLAGMVLAPIILSSPFFIFAILLLYYAAGTNSIKYYEAALLFIFGGIAALIVFVPYSREALTSYVTYQATKDNIYMFRLMSYGLILAGLGGDFFFLAYILFA